MHAFVDNVMNKLNLMEEFPKGLLSNGMRDLSVFLRDYQVVKGVVC